MPFLGSKPDFITAGSVLASTLADTQVSGSGAEEDLKIVFDGNAVDYHIGIDDSGDVLTIGKGSTLGTTTSQNIDANGIIVRPLHTSFLAYNDATGVTSNYAIGNFHTLSLGTEVFDPNGDYNSGTDTFTAPVTGNYRFGGSYRFENVDSAANFYSFDLVTSDNTYHNRYDIASWGINDPDFWVWRLQVDCPMDAGDTAKLQWKQTGGSAQADSGSTAASQMETYFFGYLL